jgi:transposase-like protein
VLIVTGVRDDGRREMLDTVLADTESEATCNDLFSDLKKRGLTGVRLVVSDDHQGLRNAVSRYFQGACWQRCQVHFTRNALGKVARRHRKQMADDMRRVFAAESLDSARELAQDIADGWKEIAPSVSVMLEEDLEQCLAVLCFPAEHRRRLRTNNAIERFNEEIKRRTRVIRIFPNRASALRLIASLCIEQSEEWLTGRQYLDMELLEQPGHERQPKVTVVKPEKMRKVG